MYANLVILVYLGSLFTWDKVYKVLRPLPNYVKYQRLLVHILWYYCFNYNIKILLFMLKCLFNMFLIKFCKTKYCLQHLTALNRPNGLD